MIFTGLERTRPYPVLRGVWPEENGKEPLGKKWMLQTCPTLFFFGGAELCANVLFYFHPYLWKWSNLTHIFQTGWFNHQPTRKLGKDSAGRFGNRCRSGMMPLAFWGEENVKKPMRHPCDEKSWITYIDPTKNHQHLAKPWKTTPIIYLGFNVKDQLNVGKSYQSHESYRKHVGIKINGREPHTA